MMRCVILGKSQPPLASVSPIEGQAASGDLQFSAKEPLGGTCDL